LQLTRETPLTNDEFYTSLQVHIAYHNNAEEMTVMWMTSVKSCAFSKKVSRPITARVWIAMPECLICPVCNTRSSYCSGCLRWPLESPGLAFLLRVTR